MVRAVFVGNQKAKGMYTAAPQDCFVTFVPRNDKKGVSLII
jgi:hypothetical protein